MKIDTIILVKDAYLQTRRCLETAKKNFPEANLILVDNASLPHTATMLPEYGKVIRNETNLGFPAGVNQGLREVKSDWVCLVNNDVIFPSNFGNRVNALIDDMPKDTGMFGVTSQLGSGWQVIPFPEPKPNRTDSNLDQQLLDDFGDGIWKAYGTYWREVPRVVGLCVFIRRSVLARLGAFDERFTPGCFEDDDYCWRIILAGWKVRVAYGLFLYHIGGATFEYNDSEEKKEDYEQLLITNWFKFASKWKIPNGTPTMNMQTQGRLSPSPSEYRNSLIHIPLTQEEKVEPGLIEVHSR